MWHATPSGHPEIQKMDPNYTWLSLDINYRYTSISHEVGLTALNQFLDINYNNLSLNLILQRLPLNTIALQDEYSISYRYKAQWWGREYGVLGISVHHQQQSLYFSYCVFFNWRYIDDILAIQSKSLYLYNSIIIRYLVLASHVLYIIKNMFLDLAFSHRNTNVTSVNHHKELLSQICICA